MKDGGVDNKTKTNNFKCLSRTRSHLLTPTFPPLLVHPLSLFRYGISPNLMQFGWIGSRWMDEWVLVVIVVVLVIIWICNHLAGGLGGVYVLFVLIINLEMIWISFVWRRFFKCQLCRSSACDG